MHNHFDKNLRLKDCILENKPKHIVECGAGHGELTRMILGLKEEYDFKLTVINDSSFKLDDIDLIQGISYKVLEDFEDGSVDLCIIDTDHNYWTLAKELNALDSKLSEGGFIALHDVSTYYYGTGMAMSYGEGIEYPEKEIVNAGSTYGGIGNAVMDFLSEYRFKYRLITFTSESQGACLIRKRSLTGTFIAVPAKEAIYSNH